MFERGCADFIRESRASTGITCGLDSPSISVINPGIGSLHIASDLAARIQSSGRGPFPFHAHLMFPNGLGFDGSIGVPMLV
jgi:hypothetical protein